jgi:hypothetical protein
MDTLSDVGTIKKFFSEGVHGRPVTFQEMKELTKEDRQELGSLCREALKAE